jgi:hypothetical protein
MRAATLPRHGRVTEVVREQKCSAGRMALARLPLAAESRSTASAGQDAPNSSGGRDLEDY